MLRILIKPFCALALVFSVPSSAYAADNIDCAINALEQGPEFAVIGLENMLSFTDPTQPFAKSGSSMDLAAAINECATENGWSKAASALASQFTVASATVDYIKVQMSVANAPEDFGKKIYNDMTTAELKNLRKTGKLTPSRMATITTFLTKYFGAKPKKGEKEMLVRWPQMLEDRDVATEKFLRLTK